jgi:hypothetical protein
MILLFGQTLPGTAIDREPLNHAKIITRFRAHFPVFYLCLPEHFRDRYLWGVLYSDEAHKERYVAGEKLPKTLFYYERSHIRREMLIYHMQW